MPVCRGFVREVIAFMHKGSKCNLSFSCGSFRDSPILAPAKAGPTRTYVERPKSRRPITYSASRRMPIEERYSPWRERGRAAAGAGNARTAASVLAHDGEAAYRRWCPSNRPVRTAAAWRRLACDLPPLRAATALGAAKEHRSVRARHRVVVTAGQLARQPVGHDRRPALQRRELWEMAGAG